MEWQDFALITVSGFLVLGIFALARMSMGESSHLQQSPVITSFPDSAFSLNAKSHGSLNQP